MVVLVTQAARVPFGERLVPQSTVLAVAWRRRCIPWCCDGLLVLLSGLSSSEKSAAPVKKSPRGGGKPPGGDALPPPLPSTAPPIHRAPLRGRKVGDSGEEDAEDRWYDDAQPFDANDEDNLYENEGISSGRPEKSTTGVSVMESVLKIDGQIYENAGMLSKNGVSGRSVNDGASAGQDSRNPTQTTTKILSPTPFGNKAPKYDRVKPETSPPRLVPHKLSPHKGKTEPAENGRSPVAPSGASPRLVQRAILAIEGATVGETDDSAQLSDDDDLYEDAETVVMVKSSSAPLTERLYS